MSKELDDLIAAARAYTYARQAYPSAGWNSRIEERGWELAEATRAYDKVDYQRRIRAVTS